MSQEPYPEKNLRRLLGKTLRATGKQEEVCLRALDRIRKRESSFAWKIAAIAGLLVAIGILSASLAAWFGFLLLAPLLSTHLAELIPIFETIASWIDSLVPVFATLGHHLILKSLPLIAQQILLLMGAEALLLIFLKLHQPKTPQP